MALSCYTRLTRTFSGRFALSACIKRGSLRVGKSRPQIFQKKVQPRLFEVDGVSFRLRRDAQQRDEGGAASFDHLVGDVPRHGTILILGRC